MTLKFQSSIGPELFKKVEKWADFLKMSNFLEMIAGGAPALRVPRAETWLTVYRSLP